jgi:hypothetical protein
LDSYSIKHLNEGGRLHIELTNSLAKFWKVLELDGYTKEMFHNMEEPETAGELLLDTIRSWHVQAKQKFDETSIMKLDLKQSRYLIISCNKIKKTAPVRMFQIHSLPLELPKGLLWKFYSPKCLQAFDPDKPEEKVCEWFGDSGGQFKYYPLAQTCLYKSTQFYLEDVRKISIVEKTSRYWPNEWIDCGGAKEISLTVFIEELQRQKLLIKDKDAKEKIEAALARLREIAHS